ncbi:MAG: FadR family transcriptional regulator, partial [Alphaproteobacteria bacterium]
MTAFIILLLLQILLYGTRYEIPAQGRFNEAPPPNINGPGCRGGLPTEPELSAELGISRNVLREAIKVLTSKGLLEVRPKTGTRVLSQESWNILDPAVVGWFSLDGSDLQNAHDFVEFRRIIEPKASYLAALRATEEDITKIGLAFDRLFACIGNP